ncbi:MAG: ZIP family metal transporter [Elusimicrobia bacterium]|nr:ZIP family metal transporter [Elusimicrobiota bacterium]
MNTAISSLAAMICTLAGAFLVFGYGDQNKKFLSRTLAFSSGILVSAAFVEILPEGFALGSSNASFGCLTALFVLFLLENFTIFNTCKEYVEGCDIHAMGTFAFMAMSLHSLTDGFNIAVGFGSSGTAGLNVSLGIILHKFVDGITIVSILLHSGKTAKNSMWLAFILSVMTPLAALGVQPALGSVPEAAMAFLLGLSGGSFVYISLADALPRLHKTPDRMLPPAFLAGCAVVFLIHRLAGN